jgi:hypothetical protein
MPPRGPTTPITSAFAKKRMLRLDIVAAARRAPDTTVNAMPPVAPAVSLIAMEPAHASALSKRRNEAATAKTEKSPPLRAST